MELSGADSAESLTRVTAGIVAASFVSKAH